MVSSNAQAPRGGAMVGVVGSGLHMAPKSRLSTAAWLASESEDSPTLILHTILNSEASSTRLLYANRWKQMVWDFYRHYLVSIKVPLPLGSMWLLYRLHMYQWTASRLGLTIQLGMFWKGLSSSDHREWSGHLLGTCRWLSGPIWPSQKMVFLLASKQGR